MSLTLFSAFYHSTNCNHCLVCFPVLQKPHFLDFSTEELEAVLTDLTSDRSQL